MSYVQMTITLNIYGKMAQKTGVPGHATDLFLMTICDLTLTLTCLKHELRNHAEPSLDKYQHSG